MIQHEHVLIHLFVTPVTGGDNVEEFRTNQHGMSDKGEAYVVHDLVTGHVHCFPTDNVFKIVVAPCPGPVVPSQAETLFDAMFPSGSPMPMPGDILRLFAHPDSDGYPGRSGG